MGSGWILDGFACLFYLIPILEGSFLDLHSAYLHMDVPTKGRAFPHGSLPRPSSCYPLLASPVLYFLFLLPSCVVELLQQLSGLWPLPGSWKFLWSPSCMLRVVGIVLWVSHSHSLPIGFYSGLWEQGNFQFWGEERKDVGLIATLYCGLNLFFWFFLRGISKNKSEILSCRGDSPTSKRHPVYMGHSHSLPWSNI